MNTLVYAALQQLWGFISSISAEKVFVREYKSGSQAFLMWKLPPFLYFKELNLRYNYRQTVILVILLVIKGWLKHHTFATPLKPSINRPIMGFVSYLANRKITMFFPNKGALFWVWYSKVSHSLDYADYTAKIKVNSRSNGKFRCLDQLRSHVGMVQKWKP